MTLKEENGGGGSWKTTEFNVAKGKGLGGLLLIHHS